jgi:TonB family protein
MRFEISSAAVVAILLGATSYTIAQEKLESNSGALLLKMPDLDYPPIARAAHVSGDVRLRLMIRRDGTVDSVQVLDGPPMLLAGSISAAKSLTFDCISCAEETVPYEVTFLFQVVPTDPEKSCDRTYPEKIPATFDSSKQVITVSTPEIWTCDPQVTITRTFNRVRAPKCLYLWRCGLREAR